MKLEDLPPDMQAQVLSLLGEDAPKAAKQGRARGVATNGVCHGCGERFRSVAKWEKHSDATGHRRFDLMLNGAPA